MRLGLFLIIIFSCFYSISNADIKEPGKKNNLTCAINTISAYLESLDYLRKNPKKNVAVYLACNPPRYSWSWDSGKNLEKLHKKIFKNCVKNSKKNEVGECYLFSVNKKILWELSDDKMENLLKVISKKQKIQNNVDAKPIFNDEKMTNFEKNIIKKKDPSSFIKIEFVGSKKVNMDQGDPVKAKIVEGVNIFKASFKQNHEILIRVHPNLKKDKAEKISNKLSHGLGQLPTFLLKSYKKINVFNEKLYSDLINNPAALAAQGGLMIINISRNKVDLDKNFYQELLIHEAGHFVFDNLKYKDEWKLARNKDAKIISKYAMTNINEDIAETVVAWVGVRCRINRISKSNLKKVLEGIPNRIKFLDDYIKKMNYDMNPFRCIGK